MQIGHTLDRVNDLIRRRILVYFLMYFLFLALVGHEIAEYGREGSKEAADAKEDMITLTGIEEITKCDFSFDDH